MKKRCLASSGGLLLLIVFLLFGLTQAQNLFSDNFEGYALDSWPDFWVRDANAHNASSNKIVPDPADPTNQVLLLYGQLGGCWASIIYRPVVLPKSFAIEGRLYNGAEALRGCHPQRTGVALRQGTTWTNPSRTLMEFEGNGTVIRGDGRVIGNYQTEKWYTFKISYSRNETQVRIQYWLNGQGSKPITLPSLPSESLMDHIELYSQEGAGLIDDLVVYESPSSFECKASLPADFNGDCYVDLADFAEFASQWLKCGNPADPSCLPFIQDNGPVASYSFDEGQGTAVLDQSGNHYDGVASNGPTWVPEIRGSALKFDGVDDVVVLNDETKFRLTSGTLTLSCWLSTTKSSHLTVAHKNSGWRDETASGWMLYIGNGRAVSVVSAQNTMVTLKSNRLVNDGLWHHVVVQMGENGRKIFIDGTLDAQDLAMTNVAIWEDDQPTPLAFGAERRVTWNWWDGCFSGLLDEIHIFDRPLTDAEVKAMFEKETLPAGPMAFYKLDDLSGPVKDETGNFDGTNNGAATGVEGVNGTAYAFNGVNSVIDTLPQFNIPFAITVSMWINPSGPGGQLWGTVNNASGGKNGWVANYSSSDQLVYFAYVSGNIDRNDTWTPINSVPMNTWSFVTFTVDESSHAKIYVNSVLQASGIFSAPTNSHDRALMIGKSILSQDYAFKGRIDDVRIYDRALTDTEVNTLYQNP